MKLFFSLIALLLFSCEGKRPMDIGVRDGKLKAVPKSPNCVSSQADSSDEEHYIPALTFQRADSNVVEVIETLVKSQDGATIITTNDNYLYAEFKTTAGWVDDVEFYVDTTSMLIHFRSASRIGHSDMGTNRERIETISAELRKSLLN